ncbi:MAG: hypothetical protein U0936_14035 [Planctomycetaceae bacterium]
MPNEPDNSIEVSLLVEHSHGVCEVTIRARPAGHPLGTTVMILKPLSGSNHSVPSHSAIANALQMQRWMLEHPMVFLEGLTAN